MGDISCTRDASSINGIDNNADDKNTYAKVSFSIYNITSTNTDVDACDMTNMGNACNTCAGGISAGNTSGTGDTGSTGSTDNNANNKSAHAKVCFNIYNIASVDASNRSGMGKEVSNNINNTSTG